MPVDPTRAKGRVDPWAHLASVLAFTMTGSLVAFSVMAADRQWRWGVPLATGALVLSAIGVLDLLGTFRTPNGSDGPSVRFYDLGRWLALTACAFAFTAGAFTLASQGRLGVVPAGLIVPSAFLALVAAVFRVGVALGPWALDEDAQARPLLSRHGFWVIAIGTLLFLPTLGSFSLIDPWETHYGEVARGMLARDDWISTWTPQSGWFWSKPVLDIWMQALAMGALGVGYLPGQMLAGDGSGHTSRPEWAVRLPTFALSLIAMYALYKSVARVWGRRAGLVAALVLATMSQWFLIAHQSITDMPFVATLSTSMALVFLALHTDPEAIVKTYEVRAGASRFSVSAQHLVLGMLLVTVLPQILYLASRNVELQCVAMPHGFRLHTDEFWSGSKGNCGLPGNAPCAHQVPVYPALQPIAQAAGVLLLLGLAVWLNRDERRVRRLCMLGAWYCAGVATLGKGVGGLALPALVGLSYVAVTARWRDIVTLEIPTGMLVLVVVALPWYLAMFARHGQAFTDELIFQHMYKRAFEHVHDTNVGDDVSFRYYIWQLGYGLFPWTGLVPLGLMWTRSKREADSRERAALFFFMWFVMAFGLFTGMPTKFHHYIFPAVPPAAILTGIALERVLGDSPVARRSASYIATLGASACLALYGCTLLALAILHSDKLELWQGGALVSVSVVGASVGARRFGPPPAEHRRALANSFTPHESLMIAGAAISGSLVVALVGRDLVASDTEGRGEARLLSLFTYNYHRAWPDSLDFRGEFAGTACFASVLLFALVFPILRRHIVIMLLGGALGYAVWGLDVYLVRCSPHWGQREIFEAYQHARANADEPIIAYRMNWLGEYFYTSNRIPAFGIPVAGGASLGQYVRNEVSRGKMTFYFVTEHASIGALKGEVGVTTSFDKLTDARLNNKFALIRATFERAP